MSGNLARRRMVEFMPAEFKLTETRQSPLKDLYDEWLARVICNAFSVPASAFITQVNRATSQTLRTQAAQEGLVPLKAWVKRALDRVVQVCLKQPDLEFAWVGDDAVDSLQQAQTIAILVNAGVKTRDEARAELGLAGAKGVAKYNHNHDELGRFTSGDGAGGASAGVQVAANDAGPTSDVGGGCAREQVAIGGTMNGGMPLEVAPKPPAVEPPKTDFATPTESSAPSRPEAPATQPRALIDALAPDGKLPGALTNPRSAAREMPAADDPNNAALQFVTGIKSGQTPLSVTPIPDKPGAYYEQMSTDTYITMRPTGTAGSRTSGDTATVEINDPKINALNGGRPLELKFPKLKQ